MAQYEKEELDKIQSGNYTKPKDRSDRVEVILINYESKLTAETITIDIERDDGNLSLEEPKVMTDATGRFSNFLCEPLPKN